jgi:hypothetical protein
MASNVNPLILKYALLTVALVLSPLSFAGPAETAKEFFSFAYGKEVDIKALCHPHHDLWMLKGGRNDEALKAIESAEFKVKSSGVMIDLIGRDIAMVELRDGKVDPSFNLETVYGMHRRLILSFIYAALPQESETIARLVTHPKNVSLGKAPKVSYGDMDQYGEIIALLPVVRSSQPESDKQSHSITYRMPLGSDGLSLRLVKNGNTWKIDTSTKVTVPLEFFFK